MDDKHKPAGELEQLQAQTAAETESMAEPKLVVQPVTEIGSMVDPQLPAQPEAGSVVEPQLPAQPAAEPKIKEASKSKVKDPPKQRHFLAVFFLSFMWGVFGVDRMYLGKYLTGILKLLTFGGFGLWILTDLAIILNGSMRDRWGQPMLGFEEYKSFAHKTVLFFSIAVGLTVLLNGVVLFVSLSELFNALQGGSSQLPGLDGLMNGGLNGTSGLDATTMQQIGL